jgi:hypothetical protein
MSIPPTAFFGSSKPRELVRLQLISENYSRRLSIFEFSHSQRPGRSGNSRRVFIPCRRSAFEVTSKYVCSRSGINDIAPAQEVQDRRNQATVIVEHDYESRLFSVRRFACGQRFRRRVVVWDLRYLDGEPLIFSNKQVWATRALALDGKGRVGAGTVNGRIPLEAVDPSILAGIGCSLIEATTSGESHWAQGNKLLDDNTPFVSICDGARPK